MPRPGTTAEGMFFLWSSVVIAFCSFLAVNPTKAFRICAWGRPLPRFLEKPWVIWAYRMIAIGTIIEVLRLLVAAARPQ